MKLFSSSKSKWTDSETDGKALKQMNAPKGRPTQTNPPDADGTNAQITYWVLNLTYEKLRRLKVIVKETPNSHTFISLLLLLLILLSRRARFAFCLGFVLANTAPGITR